MGNSLTIKRIAAPTSWKLRRKGIPFVTKPFPGAQSYDLGTSLTTLLRDLLHLARTARETRYITNKKEVLINGVRRKDGKFLVGFMDALSIPILNHYYRLTLTTKGRLAPVAIEKEEAGKKLAKIIGKTHVRGKVQLNLSDGRNLFVEKDVYKPGDSLLLSIPEQKIINHFKFEKKATIILTSGRHIGKVGQLEEITGDIIAFKIENDVFRTKKEFAFVVGKEQSALRVRP